MAMTDGAKEAAKEFSSAFRVIFSLNLTFHTILVGLKARNLVTYQSDWYFFAQLGLGVICLISGIHLMFRIVANFHAENDDLIIEDSVVITAIVCLATFVLGIAAALTGLSLAAI